MEQFKEGEYVRTTSGFIAKCIKKSDYSFEFDSYIRISYGEPWDYLLPGDDKLVINHSFNLIDLIEVGDYVKIKALLGNKEYIDDASSYVSNTGTIDGKRFIELDYGQDGSEFIDDTTMINTIVTKEQFKSMEYKVGGEDD